VGIVPLNIVDTLLGERVYVGSQDQVCKSRVCNRDIRRDVPSDERTSTRRRQNSIRISQTTNILACASNCIREGIRKHRLSCISHVASACIRWQDVPVREGELVTVSAVGSLEAMALCVVMDSAGDQEGIQQRSEKACISDHL